MPNTFQIKNDAGQIVTAEPVAGQRYVGMAVQTHPTTEPGTREAITPERAAELGIPMTFVVYVPTASAVYAGSSTFYNDDKSTRIGGQDPRVDMTGCDFLVPAR